jgi:hypothetical protein
MKHYDMQVAKQLELLKQYGLKITIPIKGPIRFEKKRNKND